MSSPLTVVAQVAALGLAMFVSGFITTFSVGIPAVALAPPLLAAQQWHALYNAGKARAPPLALTSFAAFIYLASLAGFSTPKGALLASAGACVLAIVPYTLTAMARTNGRLHECAQGKQGELAGLRPVQEGEVHALLRKWTALNFVRAMCPATGAALGFWAVLAW
ncbi:hypothetical protein CALCODRAFT_308242 [Calocera cornea HHB12733]|uniref:DUF1772-domain-containing protein n=1 Tax=Calocera cornea HHB12733 TaxID=1353952 RepID=A0A165FGF3_9BASI|nr:hypothetical protein CALCODRAFT_308242 [Calocera cornea HHB12733]